MKEEKNINIEKLQKELEEQKKRCEEYLNGWKRERADFLNYKKEEMERMGSFIKYANEELILKILPILDNMYLAKKQLPENLKSGKEGTPQAIEWTKGFLQIQNQLQEFLKKEGIEVIEAIGKEFDPKFMDAAGTVPADSAGTVPTKSGVVVEELQRGYTLHGKVIRPAKVKVVK